MEKIKYDPSSDEEIEALRKTLEYMKKLDWNNKNKGKNKADKKLKKSA